MAVSKKDTLVDKWLKRAKNRPPVAVAVFVGIVITAVLGAIGTMTDSYTKITKFFESSPQVPPAQSLPVINIGPFNNQAIDNRSFNWGSTNITQVMPVAQGITLLYPATVVAETFSQQAQVAPPTATAQTFNLPALAETLQRLPAATRYAVPPNPIRDIDGSDELNGEVFLVRPFLRAVQVINKHDHRELRRFIYAGKLGESDMPVQVTLCGENTFLVTTNERKTRGSLYVFNPTDGAVYLVPGTRSDEPGPPPVLNCYRQPR